MTTRESSEDIDNAAAEWAARLDGAPLSPEETLTLEAWAAADTRRQGALARAMAILTHFDRAKALGPQFDPRSYRAVRPTLRLGRREFMAGGALAAGIGVVAVMLPALGAQTYATARGEVRSVPLGDGSVIWLNTDSKVRVDYSDSHRGVLLVAGEALFDVAKDRSRPFIVRADEMNVRAVGTSFSVSRLAGQPIEVLVREGIVDMGPRAASGPPVRLTAGARAVARDSGPVRVSMPGDHAVLRSLSWSKGLLDFDGATLTEAAATFARYSDQRIIIDDPEIARRSVTGLFSSTNPVGFAEAVALSMNLRTRSEAGAIHLSR